MTKPSFILRSSGFTLIELLLVIVIIGILAGVMLAIINPTQIQYRARDTNTTASMNKIALAINSYISAYGTVPNAQQLSGLINNMTNGTASTVPAVGATSGAATADCVTNVALYTCTFNLTNVALPVSPVDTSGSAEGSNFTYLAVANATSYSLYAPMYGGFIKRYNSFTGLYTKL